MSLLTPPSSSHRGDRDKENRFVVADPVPRTRSVLWVDKHEIHSLSTPLKTAIISSKERPATTRSILKNSNKNSMLTVPGGVKQRECTPEPREILTNSTYLTRPLSQIISIDDPNSSTTLSGLIEGYNVLAARLRSGVTESTDVDSTWALFEPLRKNTDAFVDAIVRDLGRAFVDPVSLMPNNEDESKPKFSLPSPQKSPVKKKGGMTGEQVKLARDLCTTCHSVIRLLGVILSLPALYDLFEEKQLRRILSATLAIPLADDLPILNSRKTCALIIWLIQVQRLPAPVLKPAADRIAYALRRGIDGELGREGKKGSANDGLKAIYDLCEHLPDIFVPAFFPLLPSVLSNLVANTLTLRTHACFALSGYTLSLTSLPRSPLQTKVSNLVAAYLTTPGTPTKAASPTSTPEAAIVRTLRSTMAQTDPDHPAQGPVWGLSVMACFVVLLNGRMCTDSKVNRTLTTLLALGIGHKKSSVRAMTCLAWRCLTWAYFQPPLPSDSDEESEIDDEVRKQMKCTRRTLCKIMTSVVECQTGVANIAAILGDESSRTTEEPLRLCIELLQSMTKKSGHPCYDATQAMMQMVSSVDDEKDDEEPWDHNLLLPKSFLSPPTNGLFITEYKNITQAIRPLFENLPSIGDVRSLTIEELAKDWVLSGMMTAWKSALRHLELSDEADMPPELIKTWSYLLKANVGYLQDNDGNISKFGVSVVKYITDIIEDPDLSLAPNTTLKGVGPAERKNPVPDSDDTIPDTFTGQTKCTNSELRLRVVRRMWNAMKSVFPTETLSEAAEVLLAGLMRNEQSLLPESSRLALDEEGRAARNAWVKLCVDALTLTDVYAMRVFWGCEDGGPISKVVNTWGWDWTKEFTNAVWKVAVEKWRDEEGEWEAGIILLGVPFTDRHAWNMSSEDFSLWEEFLADLTAKALDHGVDASTVLDHVASFVSSFQTPAVQPYLSIRLADLLLSHLDAQEMRNIPQGLVDLVADTMRATYPPDTKNKPVMRWLARSLMSLLEKCPKEFCLPMLQTVQEGVCLWLADEIGAWEEDEMNYDLIPLYQHILITIQSLPDPVPTLCAASELLGSVFRHRAPGLAVEAFADFWTPMYGNIPAPSAGWPECIASALRIVGLPQEERDQPNIPETTLAPAFVVNHSPRTPISACSTCPAAIVNREPPCRIPSPQRPTKVFGNLPIIPMSPESPTVRRRKSTSSASPASSSRTPLSAIQLCESPWKRRKLNTNGKENTALSNPPLVSVAERIAEMLKPGENYRKRKVESQQHDVDGDDSSPVPKRLKARMKPKQTKTVARRPSLPRSASSSENESLDERRSVERQLMLALPSPPMRTVDGQRQSSSNSEPSSDDLQPGTPPTINRGCDSVPGPKIDFREVRRTVKRSSSTPETLLNIISTRKRKRDFGDEGVCDRNQYSGILPLFPLPPFPSRRTHSLPSRRGRLDSDSTLVGSSDDDPHSEWVKLRFGLPRKEAPYKKLTLGIASVDDDDDPLPGSDDTTASSSSSEEDSPTKEIVNRRMQRGDGFISRSILI